MEVFPGHLDESDVRFRKPCISGTRIDIATIVGLIATGETVETVADPLSMKINNLIEKLGGPCDRGFIATVPRVASALGRWRAHASRRL